MPAPPLIRLGSSCCNHLVKKCSVNNNNNNLLLRCKLSLAYTTSTCSDHQKVLPDSSSSDTNVLCHPTENQKLKGKFEVSDQWKREGTSASLLFARELKELGFKHDVDTYMAIIRFLLCHSSMDVRLNHLFMYILDNNIVGIEISDLLEALLEALIEEKLIKAVEVLVKVYASVGRFEEAIYTLSRMKIQSGLMVSTRTCNFVMNELIEWDHKVDKVVSVYRQLKRNGWLLPNVYTYEILMKGLCRECRFEEAWDVLIKQMKEAGVKCNAFIIGTYIHGLCWIRNTDDAFHIVKDLRESNKSALVDVFAYTCVIRGFVKESKLQDAEHVLLHEMKLTNVVPDADCYGALIQGYWEKGDTAKAFDLCKEMESRLGITTDYVFTRCRMQDLCGVGKHDEVLDLFRNYMQTSSTVYIDGVTFDLAIDAACQLGKMEDAVGLLEEMKDRKMKPWRMHYRTLIDGFCLRGEPWNALCIFQEMMRNGLRPDSATYHVLARGFQRCGVSLPLYMLFKL